MASYTDAQNSSGPSPPPRVLVAHRTCRILSTHSPCLPAVPVLPLLVLQTLYDERFDTRFGTRRAYVFRLVVSMVIMTGCLLIVLPKTQALVLVAAALVGVTDAAAFGAATQLFSMFPPVAGGLYFTGASLTSLISIALTFATGFEAADAASSSLTAFYICAALFILVGLAGALLLVNSRIGRHYLNAKDQELATAERARKSVVGPGGLSGKNSASETENSARLSQPPLEALHKARAARASETGEGTIDHRPLLGADAAEDADASRLTLAADSSASSTTASGAAPADSVLLAPPTIMTNKQLFLLTFSCHAALFLGWFATNTVDSLIAFVPSQKDTPAGDNQGFRLVMLYCSLGGELLGKQLNIARRGRILKTPRGLLVAVGVRTLFVLPFLLYILQPRFTADGAYNFRSDGLIATFQVLFDASGSYLSTLTYSMAAALLPSSALRAQSSTLLSLTLMMGVYVGLGVSLAIARSLSDLPRTAFA